MQARCVVWTLCWAAVATWWAVPQPTDGAAVKPPAYLMDLYEQFSKNGGAAGTAVHALLPVRGLIEGDTMLVFNLSSVHDQEVVRSGRLHLHRRLVAGPGRAGSLRLRVCDITPERVPVLEDIVLSLNSSGWQTFDVSVPVQRVLDSPQPFHLLGVKVELKPSGRDKYRLVRWRRMRRMHLQPFIVVFTDDTFSMEEDLEHNYLHVPDGGHLAALTPFGGNSGGSEAVPSSSIFDGTSNRGRRSVADNKLPREDAGYYRYELSGSEESHVPVFSRHFDASHTKEKSSSSSEEDSNLIPYPPKQKHKKWRRRKHKKRRHRKRKMFKNRQLPAKWNVTKANTTEPVTSRPPAPSSSVCRRHRLTVDFDAIGWGDWVINPQRFDAYYCAGTCAFPLSKFWIPNTLLCSVETRPTNHATIQSLAAMLGVRAGGGATVPAPCCVPDAMDSLTLLYFDESRQNVVLKNYPKMVVKSCSCR